MTLALIIFACSAHSSVCLPVLYVTIKSLQQPHQEIRQTDAVISWRKQGNSRERLQTLTILALSHPILQTSTMLKVQAFRYLLHLDLTRQVGDEKGRQ